MPESSDDFRALEHPSLTKYHTSSAAHMDLFNILANFMIESTGTAWPLWWVSLAKPLTFAKAIITIKNNNTFYLTKF